MLGVQAGFDALGQLDLVLGAEKRGLANPVQIDTHEISSRTLGIQVAVDCGGGVCHGGLLIGSELSSCQVVQRMTGAKSSRAGLNPHALTCRKERFS